MKTFAMIDTNSIVIGMTLSVNQELLLTFPGVAHVVDVTEMKDKPSVGAIYISEDNAFVQRLPQKVIDQL